MRSRPSSPTTRYSSSTGSPSRSRADGLAPDPAVVGVQQRLPDALARGPGRERAAGERLAVRPAVDGVVAARRVDLERVEVVVHRLDDARERRVRLGELGAHAAPLGDVGDDAADLDGAVVPRAGDGAVVDPARDAVGADQPVLGVALLAGGERLVEGVVHGPVLEVDRGLPVRPSRRPAPPRPAGGRRRDPGTAPPGGRRDARSPGRRARRSRPAGRVKRSLASARRASVSLRGGDVGDDPADQRHAGRPALRPGAVPEDPGDAVQPQQPVGDLRVLARQQALR